MSVKRAIGAAVLAVVIGLASPGLAVARSTGYAKGATYTSVMSSIDLTYARAVAKATAVYRASLSRARTASDRIAARTRFRAAIQHATVEREIDVENLDHSPLGADGPDNPVGSVPTTTVHSGDGGGSSSGGDHTSSGDN